MELRDGDIFIFEAEKDFLSKCIAFVTKSDVSHAALIKDCKMIEMGAPGICENRYLECPEGIKVDVMRLKPEKEMELVKKAVQFYIDSGVKYDYPQLILLGGLLLYWPFRPTKRFKNAVEAILKAAYVALDKMLNEMIHKDTQVMMCSQLVYQCYMDCGEGYIINIENGILQSGDQGLRFIDLISRNDTEDQILDFSTEIEPFEVEQLAEDLYQVLIDEKQEDEPEQVTEMELHEACRYASLFYEKLKELEEISEPGRPMLSYFVTPADLRYHAVNLEKVGELTIVRDR